MVSPHGRISSSFSYHKVRLFCEDLAETKVDISFPKGNHKSYPFMLFETQIIDKDEKTGRIRFSQTLPETPPNQEYFTNWVTQSKNQASRRCFDEVYKEISLASEIGATYLTHSEFVYQLLQKSIPLSLDLQTDVLNLTNGFRFTFTGKCYS